jgi:DNA (cytosine-5)-methyltransferase 1
MRVCELFAGVGGFRLGLEDCSDEFRFVWANQWEPSKKVQHAYDCYIKRFGENENHVNEDISKIDKRSIPEHDLLVGGFPCQDYSVARTGARGIQGVKGVLWWQIREILREKQPRFVLLENVDRLLKSPAKQRGRDFAIMLACFNDLGYSVEWRVINAAEYGFVQRRRRIFIYAFKNDTNYFNKVDVNNLEKWIHEDGFFQNQFPILAKDEVDNVKAKSIVMEYSDIVDVSDNFKFEFENSGIMTNGNVYTEKTVPRYNGEFTLLRDVLESNVDEKYYIDTDESILEKWRAPKAAKRINRVSKTGHEYVFSEGALAFPDPTDRAARTMLTSEASVNRSSHVVEDPATGRLRKLTPVEAERLNGFRDNWTNSGMTERARYFCMGNALIVGLIEKMGHTLLEIYNDEEDDLGLREVAITE